MTQAPHLFSPPGAQSKRDRDRPYNRAHDVKRQRAKDWRKWYGLKVWKQRRAEQLTREPFCRLHAEQGRTVAATVANHIVPHRGDWSLFIGGALESLCKPCHDGAVQKAERAQGVRGGGANP